MPGGSVHGILTPGYWGEHAALSFDKVWAINETSRLDVCARFLESGLRRPPAFFGRRKARLANSTPSLNCIEPTAC